MIIKMAKKSCIPPVAFKEQRPSDWSAKTPTSTSFWFLASVFRKISFFKSNARTQCKKFVFVVVLVLQSEGR